MACLSNLRLSSASSANALVRQRQLNQNDNSSVGYRAPSGRNQNESISVCRLDTAMWAFSPSANSTCVCPFPKKLRRIRGMYQSWLESDRDGRDTYSIGVIRVHTSTSWPDISYRRVNALPTMLIEPDGAASRQYAYPRVAIRISQNYLSNAHESRKYRVRPRRILASSGVYT